MAILEANGPPHEKIPRMILGYRTILNERAIRGNLDLDRLAD
jgi:hypothetical protein